MFHFKQFSIDDSKSAMKIGVDSVLLGAWAPVQDATNMLDIGAGCGILALMMAQRNINAQIDAIEINEQAAKLAMQNAKLSPWKEHITVFNLSFQEFAEETEKRYELIISNPPYFSNSLKSPDNERTIARHNNNLSPAELFKGIAKLLTDRGTAALIFPTDNETIWVNEANKFELFPERKLYIKSYPQKNAHRTIILFSKNEKQCEYEELFIYAKPGAYSEEYRQLTRGFYLKF